MQTNMATFEFDIVTTILARCCGTNKPSILLQNCNVYSLLDYKPYKLSRYMSTQTDKPPYNAIWPNGILKFCVLSQ